MNEDIENLIEGLEFAEGAFDYMLTPDDSKLLLDYIKQLQNNWNELKKCIGEWILYHSVCEEDYKELNVLEDVESKMQELEQVKDESEIYWENNNIFWFG